MNNNLIRNNDKLAILIHKLHLKLLLEKIKFWMSISSLLIPVCVFISELFSMRV